MKNILDIHQIQDFIHFLIDEIDRYQEDWEITPAEARNLRNEINNLKRKVENSFWVPGEIKKNVTQLNFPFKEQRLTYKTFFKALIFHESYDQVNNLNLKLEMDNLKNDLKAIHIKIEKYKMDNNITDEQILK